MSCNACARRRAKLIRIALASAMAGSRLFNTICNGWLDETFAARSARAKNWYYKLFPDHCLKMLARDKSWRTAPPPDERMSL